MTTIFIIHGAYGSPQENWIPWLQRELERDGHTVFAPQFPTPERQSLSSWMKVMKKYEKNIDEETIFVAHSIGTAVVLHVLESLQKPIRAAILVSPFISPLGEKRFDSINKTFYTTFDWKRIKENCKIFVLFHSDNDPYVPAEKALEVAERLDKVIIVISKAGHFNAAAGYTQFPLLLKHIEKLCQKKKIKKRI